MNPCGATSPSGPVAYIVPMFLQKSPYHAGELNKVFFISFSAQSVNSFVGFSDLQSGDMAVPFKAQGLLGHSFQNWYWNWVASESCILWPLA